MKFTLFLGLGLGAGVALSAPVVLERQSQACFVIGNSVLPAEVVTSVNSVQSRITCNTAKKTLSNVPDVTSGGVSFSSVNFATSGQKPLQFALSKFATKAPLASNDLATFQKELDVYLATEAGIRSVNGNLAIKVPKFFLEFQISRIQTAQGNAPTAAGLQIDHLRDKVLKNAAGEAKALLDQVTALAKVRA
ncbi:hypothetical protein B0T17DRAFT_87293 [Bombardia bombarda]|uniref:DUF7143 domain-containing protein n=1 Tax=Bombardia bombarda TaxID=252184 RepID=A0AA40CFK9_9PEZI|nr:hypothetical protein B0T17DRAFT_87293 [Bombardia bombarda]